MLQGNWDQDLEDELYRHVPADRRDAWGASDMSSNVFEQTVRQLSVLYHEAPIVVNSTGDIDGLIGLDGITSKAGLWPLMQRLQQYTLGMRECFIRIDVTPHTIGSQVYNPGIQYRIVTPDFVVCDSSPDDPDRPTMYSEYRLRQHQGELMWVIDLLDIRNPDEPVFGMFKANKDGTIGDDMSKVFMGHDTHRGLTGASPYPYIDSQGRPFLPVVLYHAEKTGQLFNPYDQSSLVFGSLQSSVYYTFYAHLLKDASWPQKFAVGVTLQGLNALDQDTTARRVGISTDPSSILMFQPTDDTQPQLGQFEAGADVHSMLESIAKYEFRVATSSGISPAELQRTSGDPRSGYALAVSRQGQREAQRKYAPVFRMADEDLMRKTAILSNRFLNTSYPESGYRVSYQSLPMSPEEIKALREDIVQKLAAGLISPVTAIKMLNPDLSDEAAKEELNLIRRERAEFM